MRGFGSNRWILIDSGSFPLLWSHWMINWSPLVTLVWYQLSSPPYLLAIIDCFGFGIYCGVSLGSVFSHGIYLNREAPSYSLFYFWLSLCLLVDVRDQSVVLSLISHVHRSILGSLWSRPLTLNTSQQNPQLIYSSKQLRDTSLRILAQPPNYGKQSSAQQFCL